MGGGGGGGKLCLVDDECVLGIICKGLAFCVLGNNMQRVGFFLRSKRGHVGDITPLSNV